MTTFKGKNSPLDVQASEGLASPFLEQELFAGRGEEEWERRLGALETESPFLQFNPQAFEEEIIGQDERTLVTDTLKRPNRWICAIDILSANPELHSRATGILIGPRYVLTARHIWTDEIREQGLTVSPARNGNNAHNPFGKVRAISFRFPTPYTIKLPVQHGKSAGAQTTIRQRDDYMLIVLEQDLAAMTDPKMSGALGYWGQNPAEAAVRLLKPEALHGQEIVVIGYPGDTCGTIRYSGSAAQKEKAINNCVRTQPDEWASRQWRGTGIVDVRTQIPSRMYHTADTYKGQSGAPICLTTGQTLNLVGIHVNEESAQRNLGLRVTERMLHDLCTWMNDDAGYTIASIKDNTLIVQPSRSATPRAKELLDDLEEVEQEAQVLPTDGEHEDDTPAIPMNIAMALAQQDWPQALKLAIQAGWRDENALTNLIFFTQHPDLPKGGLDATHPRFKELSVEWAKVLREIVWKAIQLSAANTALAVSGKEAAEHHPYFWGKNGKQLKKLVEEAAREVDINPGLLGTTMIVESHGLTRIFLLSGKVRTYDIGLDDFYEARDGIKARVPAFAKIQWDKKQKPEEHLNDAKTKRRIVKTILVDSGQDAVLATAVYMKFYETLLRESAVNLNMDFDALPLITKMALTRMAMAAGRQGVMPQLKDALNGKDIFVRKPISVKEYQTQRNATVRIAQALHLSDWVFGSPVPGATVQPELEMVEDFEQAVEGFFDFEAQSDLRETEEFLEGSIEGENHLVSFPTGYGEEWALHEPEQTDYTELADEDFSVDGFIEIPPNDGYAKPQTEDLTGTAKGPLQEKPLSPVSPTYAPPGGKRIQVMTGQSWVSIAKSLGIDAWDLIDFNFPGMKQLNQIDPQRASHQVNWYLSQYVGCEVATADKENWTFTSGLTKGNGSWKGGHIFIPSPKPPPAPPSAPKPPCPPLNILRLVNTLPPTLQRLLQALNISLPSQARCLTQVERKIAYKVYGDSLDYDSIYVSNGSGLDDRPFTTAIPINSTKWVVILNVGSAVSAGTLIHELAHAWQSQHHPLPYQYMHNCVLSQVKAAAATALQNMNSSWVMQLSNSVTAAVANLLGPADAYSYVPGKPFGDYGGEQIAQQVEDYHYPAKGVIISPTDKSHIKKIWMHINGTPLGVHDNENERSLSEIRYAHKNEPNVIWHE